MKIKLFSTLIFLCVVSCTLYAQVDVARYVNPFIGTGAVANSLSGNNYPGATVPFGMVQLSPDTREAPDWAQASGYDYNDNKIFGFSHTRLSGTGASDLIDILVLPVTELRRHSSFSHEDESAVPGYYKVHLIDNDIIAELTATTRVGMHRYTYPQNSTPMVFIDLDHSANKGSWGRRIENAQLRVVDEYTIEGYRIITGWAKLRKIYFSMKFSEPIATWEVWNNGTLYKNTGVSNGTDIKGTFTFNTSNRQIICKVAISPVSIENARENLNHEVAEEDFDTIRREAYNAWNKVLSKIDITQGNTSENVKTIFYTAMYHALLQPNTFNDVNGEYMAADYTIDKVSEGHTHYTTFSLWDTFRAAHPLYTLLEPERTADFITSMYSQYSHYGYLPIWQLWGQDNYCMIGNHSVPVIVDAVLKGLATNPCKVTSPTTGVPVKGKRKSWESMLYDAVKRSLTTSHPNSPFEVWDKYGYMPEELQTQSVSITLEFAYDDWCAAQMAKHLGYIEDYNFFMQRSNNWRNLFNSQSGFFQSKDSKGDWITPFDPYKYGANGGYPFTEGNAWQYLWYVPHNVDGLIGVLGGKKAFCKKLDEFFTSNRTSGEKNDNASGFVGLYVHGNEPDHHAPYLYALAGEPQKTEQLVNHIMQKMYNTSSSGYAGNDDCGEMSAWYIFSALGFYPVNPTSGEYVLGSPIVDSALLTLDNGKTFRIDVKRESPNSIYVKKVLLNGKLLNGSILQHASIVDGGILQFVLTDKPRGRVLNLE